MNFDARKTARSSLFAFICLGLLLAGCNSDTADGPLDTSRLPRVAGAKEVFASQATTIFTSPNSIAQTADAVEKTLTEGGWQKYAAPNTAARNEVQSRTMSLKRGAQALSVAIMLAPAQNNATSVQYAVLPLKTDLPFTKDASQIEYSPDRPLLTLLTAQPLNETLDFYRKELSTRGWSLWSDKLGAKQATGGPLGRRAPARRVRAICQRQGAQGRAGADGVEHQRRKNRYRSPGVADRNAEDRKGGAARAADRCQPFAAPRRRAGRSRSFLVA